MNEIILETKNISKSFPGVKALTDVSLQLKVGEVHSIVGENGAGKSTLMKIISGVYTKDEGEVLLDGKPIVFDSILDAFNNGISIVHQELVNCPNVSVAENIFMYEIANEDFGFINKRKLNQRAAEELAKFDLDLNPNVKMDRLSVSEQQVVEIVKAISTNAKVMIFDEPTSSLTDSETENLFKIINELRKRGVGILYISHRMEEIYKLCDRVTVLRDGEYVDTLVVKEVDKMTIINKMIGRQIVDFYPPKSDEVGGPLFEVKGFNHAKFFKDIGFALNKGEILGFSGLIGCGRSDLAKSICGIDNRAAGEVFLGGNQVKFKSYSDALKHGVVYLTEDRKSEGLFLKKDIKQNVSALKLDNVIDNFFINGSKEKKQAEEYKSQLRIKCSDVKQLCINLSGGNQQKVLISKSLSIDPAILIFDEPTKGIDIGAKIEIYTMMRELAEKGVGIIVISSDLLEIIGLCDRVIIMHEGNIVGEALDEQINEQYIHQKASGF